MRKSLSLSLLALLITSGCTAISGTPPALPASVAPTVQPAKPTELSHPPVASPSLVPTVSLPTLTPTPQWYESLTGHFVFIGRKHSETEIYMMDASCVEGARNCNRQLVQLTDTYKASPIGVGELPDIFDLSVSPDGSKVAFSYLWPADSESHDTDIAVLDINFCRSLPKGCTDKDFKRLTTDPAPDQEPAWSPDGKLIDFVSLRPASAFALASLYQMNADGTNQKLLVNSSSLPNPAALFSPSWSPDGQKIAFNVMFLQYRHPDISIYMADADGSNVQVLTSIAHNEDLPNQQDAGPEWSPDGKQILFWASHDNSTASSGISVLNPLTGVVKIMNSEGDWSPQWSPDGALVVYPRGGISGGLFVLPLNGGTPVRLTNARADRVVWMP